MFTMFDLFRQAQGGAAFDNLARAYGMSPDQMRAAAAALTPAFMQGFQRQAQSDGGAQRFAQLFQTETYARAFEAQAAALDPEARGAGEDALGALFGSKDVSRAVASQAAAVSGVQAQIVRQVLPVLASILMGGFMKAMQSGGVGQTSGQSGGRAGPTFPGPLGDILGQMFGGAQPQAPHGGGFGNPFQDWMDSVGAAGAKGEQSAQPLNPMGDMMGDILNTMFGGAQSPTPDKPAQSRATAETPGGPAGTGDKSGQAEPATPFDDLIATGRELSSQNADAMERIFDAFFGGAGRRES